jgi:hypothetical protein
MAALSHVAGGGGGVSSWRIEEMTKEMAEMASAAWWREAAKKISMKKNQRRISRRQ